MMLWGARRCHALTTVLQWVLQPRASLAWSLISTQFHRRLLSTELLPRTSAAVHPPIKNQRSLLLSPLSASSLVLDQEAEETVATNVASSSSSSAFQQPAATDSTSSSRILADWDTFVKPERDPRKYRVVVLSNNLQVLLVSDEMSSGIGVEAASVHVQAGHMDDTIPGLARKLTAWLF